LGKTFDKVRGKTRLVEMHSYQRRGDTKMNTKTPFDNTHIINLATVTKKTIEERFDRKIFQEIDKVVNLHPKG
jgi:hypothetical protein